VGKAPTQVGMSDGVAIVGALQKAAELFRDTQPSLYIGRYAVVLHHEFFDAAVADQRDVLEDYDGAFFRVNGLLVIRRVTNLPDDIGQPPPRTVIDPERTLRKRLSTKEQR
jgi:hypothetical protein